MYVPQAIYIQQYWIARRFVLQAEWWCIGADAHSQFYLFIYFLKRAHTQIGFHLLISLFIHAKILWIPKISYII